MGIRKLLGIEKGTRYDEERGYSIRELSPLNGSAVDLEYLALPKRDIPKLAEKYFAAMETGLTEDWCRCPWVVHPDDRDVKPGECRECGAFKGGPIHEFAELQFHDNGDLANHKFVGRRMRRTDDAPECPVHAKEGMLLYFFEWAYNQHD